MCGRSWTYWLVEMWIRLRFSGNTTIHPKVTFIGWLCARQYPCTKQKRSFPDASHVSVKRERENKYGNKYDFNNDNSLKKMKWANLRNCNLRKEAYDRDMEKAFNRINMNWKNNDKESSIYGGGVSFFKAERTVSVSQWEKERNWSTESEYWEGLLGRERNQLKINYHRDRIVRSQQNF